MEDLLDLYEQPLRRGEPVVCLDERPVQLRGEKRSGSRVAPGKSARYDYEYVRLGTANIFCAVDYGEQRGNALWDRFTVHFTPRHGSWLNQAEIENSLLNRQSLGRRRFADLPSLRTHVRAWNHRANAERLRILWRFRSTDARIKFGYDPTKSKRPKD